jgi:hypothetical protein
VVARYTDREMPAATEGLNELAAATVAGLDTTAVVRDRPDLRPEPRPADSILI